MVVLRYNHHTTNYNQVSNLTVDLLPLPQSRTAATSFLKVDRADTFD